MLIADFLSNYYFVDFSYNFGNKIMQKAAQEALDPRQVMIGGLPLMLLPMVQATCHLGMVLVVIVDVTVTHPKMVMRAQALILTVAGHQLGCLLLLRNLVQDIR